MISLERRRESVRKKESTLIIVSGDRDLLQLATDTCADPDAKDQKRNHRD